MTELRAAAGDGLIMTWRNLKRVPRIAELAIFAILQSIMFVLLFAYVFGGAIPLPGGGSYPEYLMPGIYIQTLGFASITTAIAVTDDMAKGLIDRFRSLPMARSAARWSPRRVTSSATRTVDVGLPGRPPVPALDPLDDRADRRVRAARGAEVPLDRPLSDTRRVDGIALGPDDGEKVVREARHHRILAELPEFEVIELRFGPDFEGVGLHSHDDHVDSFYVLDGEAEFTVGDEILRAGPGSYVAAPIGVAHAFRNAGDGELRMLNVHAPNVGFAQRLRRPS